jgi:hypothetical protein
VSDETPSESYFNPSDYLSKDFMPDPIPFIKLARECALPKSYATLLYSLCGFTATRRDRISRLEKGDLETLLLGKERMMNFINELADGQLEIESWAQQDGYGDTWHPQNCTDGKCRPPIYKVWSTLLQDVIRYGDPLATFRMTAIQYRKYADDHCDDPYDYDYEESLREEVCLWCKQKMAVKLESIREDLFNELSSFFPFNDTKSTRLIMF